jgi:hypothetical protein
VDIGPDQFPVIVNAMFTERSATRVVDPLSAKALALDDGTTRLVMCVVDTCMMNRPLIDKAKEIASRATGLPADRMLVSATHTHSAPSAMGCLGSRVDPRYAALLPGRIAQAITGAVERLQPARIGWTAWEDWEHTFNRRWIRRPDRMLSDPFGAINVRAHMHPGYESPDVVGPSGPVDPQFSLLAVETPDGHPLAIFGNYSMHYYGSELVSSDYFGRFAGEVAARLEAGPGFVGILSQGTSGDLMWMDYGAPQKTIGYEAFAREVAARAVAAYRTIRWHDWVPLRMAESRLELNYRLPDAGRLAWARGVQEQLKDRLPQTQPEIYALEALYLHELKRTELKLQAIGIGTLGIAAIPNEVYALTGLKLKAWNPFPESFNVELANGAEGYIPTPEQHRLGGYTTWPARTAGLEAQAEPRIVEALLQLAERISGHRRRGTPEDAGDYTRAVLQSRPTAFWRLNDPVFPLAHDATGHGNEAHLEYGIALFLPGAGSGTGRTPTPQLNSSPFMGRGINRAVHVAGGRIRSTLKLGRAYTVELWIWNGLPVDARPVTGRILGFPSRSGTGTAPDERLEIAGGTDPAVQGRLMVVVPGASPHRGASPIGVRDWHHVVWIRDASSVRIHLDGQRRPEIVVAVPTPPAGKGDWFLGGSGDGLDGLEGRIDEAAVYRRALSTDEIHTHYQASGLASTR